MNTQMNFPGIRSLHEGEHHDAADAGKRALVIDDEEVICQLVQGFLSTEGWEVDTALGLEKATEHMNNAWYSVIVCDVHLPGNTAEFLRESKERFPFTQVIMFTGDPTFSSAREALRFGAYDYLLKPSSREDLVHVVQRAYDRYNLLRDQDRLESENEIYRRGLEGLVQKKIDQLRETELRYRSIFDCAVTAILIADVETKMIFDCNPAGAKLLGAGRSDVIGHSIEDFVEKQLARPFAEAVNDGHGVWRFDQISISAHDGSKKYAQVSVGKVVIEDRTYLQIVALDTTGHVELKERNELIELELLTEQRLANIGLLASGVAHNINTPLMGIYGVAQIIKLKHPDLSDIDGVLTQVERINEIIRNLMWKSRQEQDQTYQEIDLNQLLTEELQFMDADLEFKHNVDKTYSFADEIPAIMGKYSDFSQSLMNVVRNALDSMHAKEDKTLLVKTSIVDGDIQVTIQDSGCGIAKDDFDKIFLPFYTTKPILGRGDSTAPTGTGLGLSTVQKLLSPYGAKFVIDSSPNAGTTFTICIPISLNAASARRTSMQMSDD